MQQFNPTGLEGIAFVEFTGGERGYVTGIFRDFGFSRLKRHLQRNVSWWQQNDIHFLYNQETTGFSAEFAEIHGPSICSMGFKVANAAKAFEYAVANGATAYAGNQGATTVNLPAIYGIGNSLIYFVEDLERLADNEFSVHPKKELVPDRGFLRIDHLTNNVYKGTMNQWADFYKNIFGFTEIRHFDIRGRKTGLTSYALQSPCKTFSIPINEGTEKRSQIEEYLREYKGAGIQHLAFLTKDLLGSLDRLSGSSIHTLDIHAGYYEAAFKRVPGVKEDRQRIMAHKVLVDGDPEGYLLQIFTENLFGPIFIELIQRNNHNSFGEGNFQALFDSIELNQEKRGVLV